MKKKILMIYTGGTIGMKPAENGYLPSNTDFKDTVASIRDLFHEGMPQLEVIQFDPLLDSSNIGIAEWNRIGQCIADHYDNFDGFVILHGTDTMSYSASALAFMLENLDKPVVFTGSQIPLCEIRSDGYNNMTTSVLIASGDQIREVCIYFDGKLLRGCRSTKTSSSQFAAFGSPNCDILADVGVSIKYHSVNGYPKRKGPFSFHPFAQIPAGIIKMYPGIQIGWYDDLISQKMKGTVLETFGAGNVPDQQGDALNSIISNARKKGSYVVVCSQCIQGTVSFGAYQTSRSLITSGALSGQDMTSEAALTKLIYILSYYQDEDEIVTLMSSNLRGELSE